MRWQRRRRRPNLEAFSIQMNPEQSSASGSLYEYNPPMVPRPTEYDGMGMDSEGVGIDKEARVQPFSFACELAQETFSIPVSQIMYCTLDTSQVDMNKLLGNQLSFNHVIYAHTRGQTKEVRFLKSADALGLTVSDNKAGGVFVKRISNSGVVAKVLEQQSSSICPGDLIECINGRSFINSRHMDVVKYLKELPLNSEIILRLISPEKSVSQSRRHKRSDFSGRSTIRFIATGAAVREALSALCQTSDDRSGLSQAEVVLLRRLAETVEDFVGIADEELAESIYDLERESATKEEFFELLKKRYPEFNFPPRIAEKFWLAYEYHLDPMRSLRN
ncbi:PDZ domain-containing protein GIPC3 [Taenia crassiceps]|uniref:PDZ domain-containing protein GIPC3 n=1 Tax=Taenia crassiceps TaxID=6207 RepID=A0ABR4PZK3_9CEST